MREHLPALAAMAPDTTRRLLRPRGGPPEAPAALHEAVKQAGGQIAAELTVKPWELPRWTREQAARSASQLDARARQGACGARLASASSDCCASWRSSPWRPTSCRSRSPSEDIEERAARLGASGAPSRSPMRSSPATPRPPAHLPAPARAGRAPARHDVPDRLAPARGPRGGARLRRASPPRRSSAACACRPAPPTASSPTSRARCRSPAPRPAGAGGPGAGLPRRRSGGAPVRGAGLGEDTLAVRAIDAISSGAPARDGLPAGRGELRGRGGAEC